MFTPNLRCECAQPGLIDIMRKWSIGLKTNSSIDFDFFFSFFPFLFSFLFFFFVFTYFYDFLLPPFNF